MTITDDDHDVARIIKELERRISDLEEQSRSSRNPNILVTESDRILIGDRVDAVRVRQVGTMEWGSDTSGWTTDAWGSYE